MKKDQFFKIKSCSCFKLKSCSNHLGSSLKNRVKNNRISSLGNKIPDIWKTNFTINCNSTASPSRYISSKQGWELVHPYYSSVKTMKYAVHLLSSLIQINTVGRRENRSDLTQNTKNIFPSTSEFCCFYKSC